MAYRGSRSYRPPHHIRFQSRGGGGGPQQQNSLNAYQAPYNSLNSYQQSSMENRNYQHRSLPHSGGEGGNPRQNRGPQQQNSLNAYQAPYNSLNSYQQSSMENRNYQQRSLPHSGAPTMSTTQPSEAVVLKQKKTETDVSDVRIVSAKRGQCNLLELMKSIEEVARCPICLDQVSPPVSMCANGHGTCQQCRAPLFVCSICKGNFLTVKPRILEQILQLLPKPCSYSDDGCETFSWVNDHEHELFCQFRPITCVVGEDSHCDWTGSLNTWQDHLDQTHHNDILSCSIDDPIILYYDIKGQWAVQCHVLNVGISFFLFFTYKIDGKFRQTVRYIPNKKPTHTYHFLLAIKDNYDEEIYKYKMKATVMDEEEYIENSGNCISAPIEELECLLNENEKLKVTFKVTRK